MTALTRLFAWPSAKDWSLAFGALISSVVFGLVIVKSDGYTAGALVLALVLILLSGLRASRILGFASLLLLIPSTGFLPLSTQILLMVVELVIALAVIFGSYGDSGGKWILWAAIAFIVLLGLSAERALASDDALINPVFGFGAIAVQVLLIAAGPRRPGSDNEVNEFATILCVTGLLLAVWAAAEFVAGRGLVYPLVSGVRRPVGPIGNPNYFGALLAVVAVVAFGLARNHRTFGLQGGLAVLTGVSCTLGVLITFSRGAIIGELAGLAVLFAQSSGRGRRRRVWLLIVILAVVLGPLAWDRMSEERMTVDYAGRRPDPSGDAASLRVRLLAAELAVSYALERPLTGVGLDEFPSLAEDDPRVGIYINTHNEPLRIAAEVGLLALLVLGALVWMLSVRIKRRNASVVRLVLPAAACFGVTSLFFNGLENLMVSFPVVALVFLASAHTTLPNPAFSSVHSPPLIRRAGRLGPP